MLQFIFCTQKEEQDENIFTCAWAALHLKLELDKNYHVIKVQPVRISEVLLELHAEITLISPSSTFS